MIPAMRFLTVLVLLVSLSAYAADDRGVPDPIPPDFNECVRVIWNAKGWENGIEFKTSRFDPPLTRELHAYLEYWRREGWGALELCGETEAS